jgi:hypothetical protein
MKRSLSGEKLLFNKKELKLLNLPTFWFTDFENQRLSEHWL